MTIENILKDIKADYKYIEYNDDSGVYKLSSSINIVCIENNKNIFSIERDLFYYIDNQKIDYHFVLVNKRDKKYFFLPYNKFSNWLRGSFDSCDKDEIYFGKIILQNEIDYNNLKTKLESIR